MKTQKINYYFATIIFLFMTVQFAHAQRVELEKKINEEYEVGGSTLLEIENKYGDVVVNTWNVNKVTVDVEIKAWGKNEDKAADMLDKVEIEYNKSGDKIYFKTNINQSSISINDRAGFQINYTVNMPVKNPLELENKYGSVSIGDLEGDLDIEVGYGSLQAGDLSGEDVEVELKYSKGSIQSIDKGRLSFKYSGNVTIGRVGEVSLSDKYGGVSIDEVGSIDADIAYSGLKIGTLSGALNLESKYAGCTVQTVKSGFSEVNIENAYGSVALGFDKGASFEFEVETSFGGFKNSLDGVNIQTMIEKNTSGEYAGSYGSGSKGEIVIKSSFGSVKFK